MPSRPGTAGSLPDGRDPDADALGLQISPFYDAVIEATEEAILNAMLAAETMTGRDGNTVYALEPELLLEALRQA